MPAEVIVALDMDQEAHLWSFVQELNPDQCLLKIGSELFTLFGPSVVERCLSLGFRVFLDLKFHDIPTTVARASKAAAEMGVYMFNVHAWGGPQMLAAAREAIEPFGAERPRLIAVTVLTSQNQKNLDSFGIKTALNDQVMLLAKMALDAGLDGVVCSALEVKQLKHTFGKTCLTVTPGIRLPQDAKDDQVRVLSPLEAQAQGSDYLVIGRSLTRSKEPAKLLHQLYTELRSE